MKFYIKLNNVTLIMVHKLEPIMVKKKYVLLII